MIGHFPEGEAVRSQLARCRAIGLPFEDAWRLALHTAQGRRSDTNPRWVDAQIGLLHACAAFRRAYEGEPPTRQDQIAKGLLDAMAHLYDDSTDARATLVELMEAA